MTDLVPMSFWRFPRLSSAWEDIEDIEDLFPAIPTNAPLSGLSISEDDIHIYVEAAVPGVDPKAVDITVHKGILWIKGEIKEEEKKKRYYRKATSSFSYRVALPDSVDSTQDPVAVCQNGVMKVTFVKSPKTQPKKIAVKTVGNGEKKTVDKK